MSDYENTGKSISASMQCRPSDPVQRPSDDIDSLKIQRDQVKKRVVMLESELKVTQDRLRSIEEALRTGKSKVEVVLRIYSGRPDPRWTLSQLEVEELRKLLHRGLRTPLKKKGEKLSKLGYNGFVILNEAGVRGIPDRMEIARHTITVYETGIKEVADARFLKMKRVSEDLAYYEDVNRIETWLLELAAMRGYGDKIEHFGGPSMK